VEKKYIFKNSRKRKSIEFDKIPIVKKNISSKIQEKENQ
jgi:hypothetical protein